MGILRISNKLKERISSKCKKIEVFFQKDIDEFLKNDVDFQKIIDSAKSILERNLYVIVKNVGFNRKREIFEAFVKQFGKYYGEIEYTDIKIDCDYTGCSYNRIFFHNDDAIDIENQPLYGFIQVIKEDPLKITKNYIVKVDDIVSYLEVYNPDLLNKLFSYKIPMLSYGVNYLSGSSTEILVKEPILYRKENEVFVRFDIHRVKFYYWKKNKSQPLEEKKLIYDFLEVCERLKKEIYLEEGDILIHHNKKTLHDRGDCSLEIDLDGSFNTREIFVSFVRE